jgi:hypothetical protein
MTSRCLESASAPEAYATYNSNQTPDSTVGAAGVPTLDLVVVVHAGLYDSPLEGSLPIAILNCVLASIEPRL